MKTSAKCAGCVGVAGMLYGCLTLDQIIGTPEDLLRADLVLTGDESVDIAKIRASGALAKLRKVAAHNAESFSVVMANNGMLERAEFIHAPKDTGGFNHSHVAFKIGGSEWVHASLALAGGIIPTVALQFRNAHGVLLGSGGAPTTDDNAAMSWSVFTGAHAAKPVALKPAEMALLLQGETAQSLSENVLKIFGIALAVLVGATIARWVIGILAFLAGQLLLLIAAAAVVGIAAAVLKLFGFDVASSEGRNAFVDFLGRFFSAFLEAAEIVFVRVAQFVQSVQFSGWPPQLPQGAFDAPLLSSF